MTPCPAPRSSVIPLASLTSPPLTPHLPCTIHHLSPLTPLMTMISASCPTLITWMTSHPIPSPLLLHLPLPHLPPLSMTHHLDSYVIAHAFTHPLDLTPWTLVLMDDAPLTSHVTPLENKCIHSSPTPMVTILPILIQVTPLRTSLTLLL